MVVSGGAELSAELSRPPVIEDFLISDLPRLLSPGDLVVLNDTRVFPARLGGRKESGGRIGVPALSRTNGSPGGRVEGRRGVPGSSRRPGARPGVGARDGGHTTA